MSKPKEFWLNPNPECRGWSERKPDEWICKNVPPIHVVEKSAYDKAVEALKYIEDTEEANSSYAREVLKELGEL